MYISKLFRAISLFQFIFFLAGCDQIHGKVIDIADSTEQLKENGRISLSRIFYSESHQMARECKRAAVRAGYNVIGNGAYVVVEGKNHYTVYVTLDKTYRYNGDNPLLLGSEMSYYGECEIKDKRVTKGVITQSTSKVGDDLWSSYFEY